MNTIATTLDTPAGVAAAVTGHRAYLVRFARQRLHDAALVEDVVQDTLLAALQGLERFAHKASLRTWLTGILLNKIADSVRRDRRSPRAETGFDTVHDDTTHGDDEHGAHDEPVEWRDPERLLEGRQFIGVLRELLQTLPPQAAQAFTLREIDGLDNDEAALRMGVTPSHCAVLLHRARAKLRRELEKRRIAPRGAMLTN